MRLIFSFFIAGFLILSCKKEKTVTPDNPPISSDSIVTYTIRQGQHYCDQNAFVLKSVAEMKFKVWFDSSCIYTTTIPANQYDINKLYGISEGLNHQVNSARIGWRWSDDSLRLFGYVYKDSIRYSQEISAIPIGAPADCSIRMNGNQYDCSVNGIHVFLPRSSSDSVASGYLLYPYFGGDETAPHLITIKIKNL
jgi:hypothetical protein